MNNLGDLETLSYGSNMISSMLLPDNLPTKNLRTLDFQLNGIEKISAKDVEILKKVNNLTLNMKGNNINYIEPKSFNSMKFNSFNLAGCGDLSALLEGLYGLTTNILRLGTFRDSNKMQISPTTLHGLCNISVQEVNLQYVQFDNLAASFLCLTKIQKLDLTHTNIDDIPAINRDNSLNELILNSNSFNDLCDLNSDSFPLLTHLHIRGNTETMNLGTGCLKNLSKLQYLDLSHSGVASTSCCSTQFKGLSSLRHLNLSYNSENNLLDLAFPDSEKLEILDFSHTHLFINGSVGPFNNLRSLRVLNLSHSNINTSNEHILEGLQNLSFLSMKGSTFHSGIIKNNNLFLHAPNLEVLILSSCELTAIEEQAFHKLKQLNYMDLSYNKLTIFSSNAFSDLSHIYLNFAGNMVKLIPFYLVHNVSGKSIINLSHNPLDCSCSNNKFISWYKQNKDTFEDQDNTVCGAPTSSRGIKLSKMTLKCFSALQISFIVLGALLIIICLILIIRNYFKNRYIFML
ncbi:hypothetical protein FKM82_000286 [Ascaphus truei]